MHGGETRALLRHYLEQGVSKTELAKRLGVSRRTVYHWIETGQLERAFAKRTCRIFLPSSGRRGCRRLSKPAVQAIRQQAARSGPSTKTLPTKKGQTNPSLTGPKTLLNETI
jgi:excisionase family DNA binding protein